MASHTSLDDKNDTCTCVCCKPKRRRRSCRPRCRPRRRQCAPKCCCRPRRRPRKMGYCMSKCDECGSNPCKKNCSCGCAGRSGVCDNKATKCPEGPNCDTSSDAFMNFLSAYNRKYGNSRNIVTVAPEAGRMWHDMNDEEREQYNYTSPWKGRLQIKHYDTSNNEGQQKGKNVVLKCIYNPKKNNLKHGKIEKYSNYLNSTINKISRIICDVPSSFVLPEEPSVCYKF